MRGDVVVGKGPPRHAYRRAALAPAHPSRIAVGRAHMSRRGGRPWVYFPVQRSRGGRGWGEGVGSTLSAPPRHGRVPHLVSTEQREGFALLRRDYVLYIKTIKYNHKLVAEQAERLDS